MTLPRFTTAAVLVSALSLAAHAGSSDFNGDGFDDLVVSVIGEAIAGSTGAGGVHVIYGSSTGLRSAGDQFFSQDSSGIADLPELGDRCGWAHAAGDFDGDGFADLAFGAPYEDLSGINEAGAVHVVYGSSSGLRTSGDQFFHRDAPGILGDLQTGAFFGWSLAAGDFDNDGRDDLAIGIPGQTVGGSNGAGEIHILYGSSSGLTASGDQRFNEQDLNVFEDDVHLGESFGFTLAVGDFDGDNRDDLAIGAPSDRQNGQDVAGAAYVLYGTGSGLRVDGAQGWSQSVAGVIDTAEAGDRFGFSLAAGDFDGNNRDDLAIGVPGEDVDGMLSVGALNVLYGTSHGLDAAGDQFWHQDSTGVRGSNQEGQDFAVTLAAGDFDGDGRDDLAAGVQFEVVGAVINAGAVNVLYGSASGLQAGNDDYWHQDSDGVRDHGEDFDNFGVGLFAGDYDGNGRSDLAIGVLLEDINGQTNTGAVNVLYGAASGLQAGNDDFWHQDSDGINDTAQQADLFGFAPNLD